MTTKTSHLFLMLMSFMLLVDQTYATSAKALGMGNAGVAYPQDSLSSAFNPAHAASIGTRMDLWAAGVYSPYSADIDAKRNDLHAFGRRMWTLRPAIGFNQQLCPHLAIGFIAYNRYHQNTHFNKPYALFGSSKFGHAYEQYAASTILAYNWGEHQLGISLDMIIGRHKVSGLQHFDQPDFTVAPGRTTNRGYDWNHGFSGTIGWLWHMTPEFKLGVSFSPETKMSRFRKYRGFIPKHGVLHSPQTLAAGLSWRFLPSTTFVLDGKYVWSRRIRAAKNPIPSHLTRDKLGSKHGAAFGFRNLLTLHAGFDHALCDHWIVRAGYFYQRELQKRSQAFFDLLSCTPIEHHLTLGATYRWNDRIEMDLFYVHGFKREKKGTGAIPTALDRGDIKMKRSLDTVGVGMSLLF